MACRSRARTGHVKKLFCEETQPKYKVPALEENENLQVSYAEMNGKTCNEVNQQT